jgi:hypothetical protein
MLHCTCGDELRNVPPNLEDLDLWRCHKCAMRGVGAPPQKYKRAKGKDVRVPMPVMQPGKGRK